MRVGLQEGLHDTALPSEEVKLPGLGAVDLPVGMIFRDQPEAGSSLDGGSRAGGGSSAISIGVVPSSKSDLFKSPASQVPASLPSLVKSEPMMVSLRPLLPSRRRGRS